MNLSETQRKFPLMVAELIRRSYAAGYELTFGEAFRTEEQQRLYVRSGRSRTMSSLHMKRLAIDFNLFRDGKYIADGGLYRPLGEMWESVGGRWGGSISAAWFLREFAGETPWVHLDIAGTAWLDDAKPYMAKGPSGVAVRTFARLAMDW